MTGSAWPSFSLLAAAVLVATLLATLPTAPPAPSASFVTYRVRSVVDGTPPQDAMQLEGTFFAPDAAEPLILRGEGEPWGLLGVYGRHGEDPPYGVLEFYRGGTPIGRRADFFVEVTGVCRSPETGRLSLLLHTWDGAVSIPGGIRAATYEPETGRIEVRTVLDAVEYDDLEGLTEVVHCGPGEQVWSGRPGAVAGVFRPCACSFEALWRLDALAAELPEALGDTSHLELEAFSDAFLDGTAAQQFVADGPVVSDAALTAFLDRVSRLGPGSPLIFRRLDSPRFGLVSVRYERPIWGSYQLLLVRARGADAWRATYAASVSSRSFQFAELLGFADATHATLDVCVDDCDWWGRRARVVLDLASLTARPAPTSDVPTGSDPTGR